MTMLAVVCPLSSVFFPRLARPPTSLFPMPYALCFCFPIPTSIPAMAINYLQSVHHGTKIANR
jgi:hypothetical protein